MILLRDLLLAIPKKLQDHLRYQEELQENFDILTQPYL